ncbi:MAG: undecaprenyl-phosphate alpha-N-acetylglucosaminyltransferase [uncultured bacterium]|uniref:Glycosyl transferase, family 4, conserved region-containing protein n=1 Tax=Candidatus Daviesbacteria bacterium GW2011_GWC2_40_12 TaxID=1618431 RepID=A0A0G0QX88_9BACT|nr:MAG: undecaprenyl-phosphate alpha-N-acetylglucosaminyltransferase [uncultured bacterium]KKQ83583.1 MAG: Glycosyl transferase, family 4, conserved region-containing protein [Candidatus Daviesbacteria bacterium GW2011_GWF2_38_7]KKR15920.1 MAG: Glycosyl transferase, family 4, conserved region-containing protein [Candidatus Daviesbacteria bacterium GW2011_GWA2_39_33]KKR25361.1 MAG: Glycosyl transferase, family 4, conserved region-containing protein [Candidatus Daviesbacteria bacterium GW2011_GWB1
MDLILPALISFAVTFAAIPFTIKIAKIFNLIDNPETRPHPAHTQKRIVPRAGGLAVFFGITIAAIIFTPFGTQAVGILIGLSILLIVGLLDDRYKNFSPYLRLLAQVIAATVTVASGISIKFMTNPFGGILHFDSTSQMILLADLLAIIWIVWVMNMINWSKGVDGQMPGIVTIAAIILGLLSLKINLFSDPSQTNVTKLAFITAASSAGLLIFNWHPAKIFPGFSGSTILGFMIAVLAILSGAKLATAGLVLLIPATDFAYTFTRRIISGKSPVWGDRGHLHHKLLEKGLSHQQISLFYILGSAILGAAALSLSSQGKLFAAALVGTVILGGILWLNFFGLYSKRRAPDNG